MKHSCRRRNVFLIDVAAAKRSTGRATPELAGPPPELAGPGGRVGKCAGLLAARFGTSRAPSTGMDEKPDTESDPYVVSATLDEDDLELVLTAEGYAAMEEGLAYLREIDPSATFRDVFKWMLRMTIEELEAEMEERKAMN